jgi:hypothetical protein
MSTATLLPTLSEAEYRALPAWSQSQWKLLPDSPELFHGLHVAKPALFEIDPTDDMELGSQLHAVYFEGQPLLEIPRDALSSNGQRRGFAWEDWCRAHKDNQGLLPRDARRVRAMCRAIDADPLIAKLLRAPGRVEQSFAMEHDETGLPTKGRLDKLCWLADGLVVPDLKSTGMEIDDPRIVGAKMAAFGYHQQAAHYLDLVKAWSGEDAEFCFVFVASYPPYTARLWTLTPEAIDLGRQRNRTALLDLRRRLDSGKWLGTRAGKINEVDLPHYEYREGERDQADLPEALDHYQPTGARP